MKKAGKTVHESVHVVGLSASAARGIAAAAMADDPEYRFVELNALTHQAVRSTGFLSLRRVESCTITVVEGSTGAVLTISGRLLPDRLDRLKAALAAGDAAAALPATRGLTAATAPDAVAPVVPPEPSQLPLAGAAPVVEIDEETVHRPLLSPAAPVPAARYMLRFDHGEVRPLDRILVVGRDPSGAAGGPGAERIVLDDGQVSKAHATLGVDDEGAWVEDLHSTNGTHVHVHGRDPVAVAPGLRHRLAPGSVVRFGTRFITLSSAD